MNLSPMELSLDAWRRSGVCRGVKYGVPRCFAGVLLLNDTVRFN
jgi:hypothetical protein